MLPFVLLNVANGGEYIKIKWKLNIYIYVFEDSSYQKQDNLHLEQQFFILTS